MHMMQRLQAADLGRIVRGTNRRVGLPIVEVPFTGTNLQRMATILIEAFNDRRVELFENADLRRDLIRLRVEERPYGFRLTSPRDETGHGDLATAFSLAMLAASDVAAAWRATGPWAFPVADDEESAIAMNRLLWSRGINPETGGGFTTHVYPF